MVLAPARTRLKDQIERARQCAEKNPANAANAARELLGHARRSLALFDLFFGLDSDLRNELSDEIAALCNQLQVTYHKATGDDKTCLDTLNAALPFATAIELRQQIQKNLDTLTRNLTFQKLDPVYALLRTIQTARTPPVQSFAGSKGTCCRPWRKRQVYLVSHLPSVRWLPKQRHRLNWLMSQQSCFVASQLTRGILQKTERQPLMPTDSPCSMLPSQNYESNFQTTK